jgi:hypothetical protein
VEDGTTLTMACSVGRGGAPTDGDERRQWRLGFAGTQAGKRSKGHGRRGKQGEREGVSQGRPYPLT